MVLTFPDYEIIARITNNFADYEKIAGITNYFGVEFLKISFYLLLFVKMEFFRQKERIQVIKYIYLFKKKKLKRRLRLGHISSFNKELTEWRSESLATLNKCKGDVALLGV